MSENIFVKVGGFSFEIGSIVPRREFDLIEFYKLLKKQGKEVISIGIDEENHILSFYLRK